VLPGENGTKPAIVSDYFPSRMHAFVWRNWTVVPKEKLARVLNTSAKNVEEVARSMGLPRQGKIESEWATSQGYITVLRRNWHLLPYSQLLDLLDMSRDELAFRLIDDDFLFVKLGNIKPFCEPLQYTEPTPEMKRKAAGIAASIRQIKEETFAEEAPRFSFIKEFQASTSLSHRSMDIEQSRNALNHPAEQGGMNLRLISSYCAAFGDPLLDPNLSSFPEGLLQSLASEGVNGVWFHTVLRTLVAEKNGFPGDEKAPQRIEGLKRLVKRAAEYGIKIYLYTNEPRAIHSSFFNSDTSRLAWGGAKEGEMQAFCTSHPMVRQWLTESLEEVFRKVDGLGGVFTITASENLTSCASHGRHHQCDRCKERSYADIIAEVNTAISEGVKRGNPDAKVLVWDWGWADNEAERIIAGLPKNCWLMSVSEWSMPIERGGIASVVGEYSISSVGPGPRALRHWQFAKQNGLKTVAKVQVNATWEMAAVPAIPALDLVAAHAENLSDMDMDGVMLSWSVGGYPSENLKLFQSFRKGQKEETLMDLAVSIFGQQGAPDVREAWRLCSEAFREFPYHIQTLYNGPQQMGAANPFYATPSNYSSTMVGIPYDDVKAWTSVYPVPIWIAQFEKCAEGFAAGAAILEKTQKQAKGDTAKKINTERLRMSVIAIQFQAVAEQARYTDARNRYLANDTSEEDRKNCVQQMRLSAQKELELIKQLIPLVKQDSTIGYESSNHYFFLPIDLLEAYISVCNVLEKISIYSS
jgi:hypothetical protein